MKRPAAQMGHRLRRGGPGADVLFRMLRPLARICLQTRCVACAAPIAAGAELGLCPACRDELAPRLAGYCPACGLLLEDPAMVPSLCAHCLETPPLWDHMYFHGAYRGLLGDLLRAYKFRASLGMGRLLQSLAVEAFFLREYAMPDLVVPVPLHARRLLDRGFNQSLELGRLLGRRLACPLEPRGLRRVRATRPQISLERKDRLHNVRNAFATVPELVRDRRVLLVDDVMTTGTTLQECARCLREAGAYGVDVLVLARA